MTIVINDVQSRLMDLVDTNLETAAYLIRHSSTETANSEVLESATRFLISRLSAMQNVLDCAELIAVDQLNILLAIDQIQDCTLRGMAALNYFRLVKLLQQSGVNPYSKRSQVVCAIAAKVMFSHDLMPVAELEHEVLGLEQPTLFVPGEWAIYALSVTWFRTRHFEVDDHFFREVLESRMLLEARKRNLFSLGMLIATHACLFPNIQSTACMEWVSRIRRNDGLYGVWALFIEADDFAAIKASVSLHFGVSMARKHISGTKRKKTSSVSSVLTNEQCERAVSLAIVRICSWLTNHLNDFHVAGKCKDQQEFGDRVKPLVELLLLTYQVKRSAESSGNTSLVYWTTEIGKRFGEYLDWEGLREAIRFFPTSILVALAFPLIERISGRLTPGREEILGLVQDRFSSQQERIPMRTMDYWYMRWLFESDPRCIQQIQRAFRRSLFASCSNPTLFSNDGLYDITHAVFYVTCFGEIPPKLTIPQTRWARTYLPQLTLACTLDGNFDLSSELMLSQWYLGLESARSTELSLRLLTEAVSNDGFVDPPQTARLDTGLSHFEKVYHTTLVALAALVESQVRIGQAS